MARLLITGGAGYVGSHCVKALTEAGHECVVYDDLSTGHRELVKWGPLIEGDIRDADALAKVFRAHSFEGVLHFAALALVGESMRDPERYRDVNVRGTRNLLEAMTGAGVSALVFSSTCAVYGEPAIVPITEAAPFAPINPYGETKAACERLMDDWSQRDGVRSVRLRYFNAAGADAGAQIGEWHENETHLIPLVLDVAAGAREAVDIYGSDFPTPDGTAVRDYIHVSDLADAHARALAYLLGGGATTALNLGTGRGISVRAVVDAARQVTGHAIPARTVARREGDPPVLVAAPGEAQRVLGWRARLPEIETIIADAWRWHQVLRRDIATPSGQLLP